MPAEWKRFCPIDEEELPVLYQAWRSGWGYHTEHGDDLKKEEAHLIALEMIENPSHLSAWLHGYNAADYHERSS